MKICKEISENLSVKLKQDFSLINKSLYEADCYIKHKQYDYANDRLISEFKMDIKIEDWILGFQVCGKQNITFSKLIVEEID